MPMSIATELRGTLFCVTSSDAAPTSRRALRAQAAARDRGAAAGEPSPERVPARASAAEPAPVPASAAAFEAAYTSEARQAEPEPVAATEPAAAPDAVSDEPADDIAGRRIALAWVDPEAVAARRAPADLTAASSTYVPVLPDLLPRRRSAKGALAPLAVMLALAGGYTAATQLWTLDNIAPVVGEVTAPVLNAPASGVSWPGDGIAAVGVNGMGHTLASDTEPTPMASITKVISVLMVQEREPLEPGDEGPSREISYSDRVDYWNFLARGESATDVPVGGTLTQYQLMQGALIASAGNYTEMLTQQFWPTDESFAAAAEKWLASHELQGITVVEPTGIDRGNTADAASLIRLASLALADPVVAEIVATESAEIPGVGTIENTNPLVGEDGVVGVKTGGLIGSYNLLAARDLTVGDQTVQVYAAVLGQPTEPLRGTVAADLLAQVSDELSAPTALAAGTPVASVTTAWGTEAQVVTATDAAVLLWNTARVQATTDIDLGAARAGGDVVGELVLDGPVDDATTALTLSDDLGEPDPWWRFTHPLELWGFAD